MNNNKGQGASLKCISPIDDKEKKPKKKGRAYIFLDVDGVLNSDEWYHYYWENDLKYTDKEYNLDYRAVERINRLIEATGAEIVLSSSWRFDMDVTKLRLSRSGLRYEIAKKLPGCEFGVGSPTRGELIAEYVKNQKCKRYVIFDDDTDMTDEQKEKYFVHTDPFIGLTDADIDKAIEILSREPERKPRKKRVTKNEKTIAE